MAKKKSTFFKDFKAFISKGNILDMAVGVVIGGAFGKIVTGLVNYIINPLVSLLTGGTDLSNFKTVLRAADEVNDVAEVAILWGDWIQTIIDFLIVALCIFIILRVIVKAREKVEAKKIAEAEAKAAEEKAKADADAKAAAEAKAAADARQKAIEDSILNQEKLLAEICKSVKK